MLIERPDFRAWLARYDADTIELRARLGSPSSLVEGGGCDGCGGRIGDTPSQAGEECLVCLAEKYGADHIERALVEKFVTGLVREAICGREPNLLPETIRRAVDRALDAVEFEAGARAAGLQRGCE